MASYHCTVRVGGKGRAGVHAEYIMREGKYAPEHTKGKSRLEDMEHTTSGNMPAWAEHETESEVGAVGPERYASMTARCIDALAQGKRSDARG